MRLTLKIWHLSLFLILFLILFFILFLTGCDNGGPHRMYVSTQAKEEKRFTVNPHPQQHYQMTITIENAPGTFEKLDTFAYYRAINCRYMLRGPAGSTAQPNKEIPLQFTKISETQYQGDFYVDAMLDEDYNYGDGICHWRFGGVAVGFSATGAKEDTEFEASIINSDLATKKLELNHLKIDYPREQKMDHYLSTGKLNKTLFKPEEYFTFYVEIEEIE